MSHVKSPDTKRLTGNPGRRTIPEVPELDAISETAPPWLDAQAVAMWESMITEVSEKALLVDLDRHLLALACQDYSNGIKAQEVINEKGFVDEYKKKRPEVKLMYDFFERFRVGMAHLGLTPAARHKGVLSPKKKNDPTKEEKAKIFGV